MDDRPTIFISYRRADIATVRPYKEELETLGYDVFFDQDDIDPGADWRQTLADAIEACDYLIAFFSPVYIQSEICLYEVGTAIDKGKTVLPVMITQTSMQGVYAGEGNHHLSDLNYKNLFGAAVESKHNWGLILNALPTPPTQIAQQRQQRLLGMSVAGAAVILVVIALLSYGWWTVPTQIAGIAAIIYETDNTVTSLALNGDDSALWFTTFDGANTILYHLPTDGNSDPIIITDTGIEDVAVADIEVDCAGNLWLVHSRTILQWLTFDENGDVATSESIDLLSPPESWNIGDASILMFDASAVQPADLATRCIDGSTDLWIGYRYLAHLQYDSTINTIDEITVTLNAEPFIGMSPIEAIHTIRYANGRVYAASNDGRVGRISANDVMSVGELRADELNRIFSLAATDSRVLVGGLDTLMELEPQQRVIYRAPDDASAQIEFLVANDTAAAWGTTIGNECNDVQSVCDDPLWVVPIVGRNPVADTLGSATTATDENMPFMGGRVIELVIEADGDTVWVGATRGIFTYRFPEN